MRIQKNIDWLAPYIKSVSDLIPINRINRVIGYKVPVHKEENNYATIIQHGRKFNINLKIYNNSFIRQTQKTAYMADILTALSHELAHIKFWDHNPNHFRLQSRIMLRFSSVLKQQKIHDTYKRIKT